MNATHSQCSLHLHPEQARFVVTDLPAFIHALQEIGLIAQKIDAQKNMHYYVGNRYLDYIAYMGCAPSIQFEASDNNENFCLIKIQQHTKAELIHNQKQSRAPHCPNCNKPVNNWQATKTDSTIHCEQCNTTSDIEKFNWRKMAGYARLFIEITDIFPKEAIPQQLLLDKLSKITGADWQYFYGCQ